MRLYVLLGFYLLLLVGCGPVQFSTNSNSGGDPTPTPTDPPVDPKEKYRNVVYEDDFKPDNKLDLLLLLDDSNSMLADNKKLGDRLVNLVTALQNSAIDWQMCVAVTNADTAGNWGGSYAWSGYTPAAGVPSWVLKPGPTNLSDIFKSTILTIGAGWAGTNDERGIKAAYWHLYNGDPKYDLTKCYRTDAAVSMILISDEDERSVGGNKSLQYCNNEYAPLENDDTPESLVAQVKNIFGTTKRFSFNSIVVKSGDSACMAKQDADPPPAPNVCVKSHYGIQYEKLAQLTSGGIGNICDSDYSGTVNYFKDKITTSLSSLPLECAPVDNTVDVTLNPPVTGLVSTIDGTNINFKPSLAVGTHVIMKYKCPIATAKADPGSNRIPAGTEKAKEPKSNGGFFDFVSGIWNSILKLFGG